MVIFKSIVVFDIETTGLPSLDHHTTKITELAFVGCEIEHLDNNLPRVLHKVLLCFNPQKMIQPKATEVSGLCNELLKNLQGFSQEDVDMLNRFINRLPLPVCIVAHNGNRFDFPILKKVLHNLNHGLPDDVYCADSLIGFREILSENTSALLKNHEITPKFQRTFPTNSLKNKAETFEQIEEIPSKKKCCNVRRVLFPDGPPLSSSDCVVMNQIEEAQAPSSHKLRDIYFFLNGEYFPDAHRAEEDAEALLNCIIKKKDKFIDWMNKNAVKFSTIERLV